MTDQQQRVNKLIERIEKHQQTIRLSDARFVARYQEMLRSTDTWRRRLCGRRWDEIGRSLDKHEQNLNRLVALLDGGQEIGEYFDEMPIAKHAQVMYDFLQGATTDRRVVFLIGPTGVGKSWAMKHLARQNEREAAYLYATECWDESMPQIARGLAERIGASIDRTSGRNTFGNVTKLLRAVPCTILLDDVQKAGVLGLKLIKSLVDDTKCRFILGVYPTSWNRLIHGSTDAYAEAQQILGRTIKPIAMDWREGLRGADISAYMKAAGVTGDVAAVAKDITADVRANGNLRLVADAVSLAQMNADEQGGDLTANLVAAAVREFCPRKEQR
jgi:hypothetical protein